MIQVYLVAACSLAYSYPNLNASHSASYIIIIISVLLLYAYSKGITHNHKARFQIYSNNTHHSKGISPSKAILLRKDTLISKDIFLKIDIKVKKKEICQLEIISFNRCSSTLLCVLTTAALFNRYHN